MTYTYKGIVKDNKIVLEGNVRLPEGAEVQVRTECSPVTGSAKPSRQEAFARVLEARAANAGLHVGIDEIIQEEKEDREARFDHWLFPKP
jgi:hypothetical protein